MTEISKNALKTRCFFANMCFRYVLCDSNHKKTAQNSSTIPFTANLWAHSMGEPLMFNYFLKRRKSMKCSYDKTFTLTTSQLQALAAQSALGFFLVRSVECGLFA